MELVEILAQLDVLVINLGASGSMDDTTVQLPSVIKVVDKLWVLSLFLVLGK